MTELAYHATPRANLARILKEGLSAGTYWATDGAVNAYYGEVIADEGDEAVTLRLPLDLLENFQPQPDRPGLQEPLTSVLGLDEEEVWERWEASDQSWQACRDLIGSFRINQAIPAYVLMQHNPTLLPTPARPRP